MKKLLFSLFFVFAILQAQEDLKNNSDFGQLKIIQHININSYYFIIDKNYENIIEIISDSIITLSVGRHELIIISKDYEDYEFEVNIEEGKTESFTCNFMTKIEDKNNYKRSSYPWIKSKINTVIYTDDDSELFVNGEYFGKGSISKDFEEGKYIIESKNTLAGTSTRTINITSKQLQTILIYNKPEKSWSQLLSFSPGASQIYKGHTFRGYMYIGLTATCLGLAVKYNDSFEDNNDIYKEYKLLYNASKDKSILIDGKIIYPILENANKAKKFYSLAKNDAKIRDILIYTTLGIYLINILDALLIDPDGGYRQTGKKSLLQGFSMHLGRNQMGINYSIKF
ncbi:MAG: hypothetical protein IPM32_15350 [Ignavibacteriae bacterium]|nr:hypothetical protein [Ignavibacteriota bacterium]